MIAMINVNEESGYIEQSLCQRQERLVILEDNGSFVKKLKKTIGVCLAQSRKARKEKRNSELSKCYKPLLLIEQAYLFLRFYRYLIFVHIVLFILSLRLCVFARKLFYITSSLLSG